MPRNTTNYIISGTKSLRLASKKWLGFGTNLQNIEKSMRAMYWADEGKKLCQRDQSGAEALIVAYLCRNGNFRKLFLNRIKPHVFVGLHIFKDKWKQKISRDGLDIHCDFDELCSTPIELLTSNPWWKKIDRLIRDSDNWDARERYYFIAKQVCHSSNYDIKAPTLCLNTLEKSKGQIVLQIQEAKYFLDMYRNLFPEIPEWHREVEQHVREYKVLYNLQGYPIEITWNIQSNNDLKECYAIVPQATVACITRDAYIQTQNFIEETDCDWDLLADTHDSLTVQCPESDEETNHCHSVMKQFIEPTLSNTRGEKFSMKSEGGTGSNWAPYHPTRNPAGLKEALI